MGVSRVTHVYMPYLHVLAYSMIFGVTRFLPTKHENSMTVTFENVNCMLHSAVALLTPNKITSFTRRAP